MTHAPQVPSTAECHPIQITTIQLNNDNFLCLSQSVRMYIQGRGKINYLTGDTPAPNSADLTYST